MSALPPGHQSEQDLVGASEDAAEVSRRGAFKRLAGWSKAVIAAVMFGAGSSAAFAQKPKGGGWINGGGWVNTKGGWTNSGGGGGGWNNRGGGWINGGGWTNRGGGWTNRRT